MAGTKIGVVACSCSYVNDPCERRGGEATLPSVSIWATSAFFRAFTFAGLVQCVSHVSK